MRASSAAWLASAGAVSLMREYLVEHLLRPLIDALGTDHPEVRAGAIASQIIGLGVLRYVLAYEPLASAPVDAVVALVASGIQRIVDLPTLPGSWSS